MSSIYLKTFYDCAWFRSKLDKRHLNKQKWENLPDRLPTITLARRKKTDSNTLHQWYGSATKCVQATVCVSWRWHNSLHRGMWWNCSSHWLKYQDTLGVVVRFCGELSAHTHTHKEGSSVTKRHWRWGMLFACTWDRFQPQQRFKASEGRHVLAVGQVERNT